RGIDGGTLVAAMTELSDERRTVLMDGVAEAPQVRNHAVVPIVHLGPGADAAGWVDTGAAETADQAAAALRLADEVAQIFLGRSAVGDESGAQRRRHDAVSQKERVELERAEEARKLCRRHKRSSDHAVASASPGRAGLTASRRLTNVDSIEKRR